ncbi:MAG TPA: HDOD domain-containing protein [Candidatus Solibacter sp.]|nr:HDOD domain-containing protein [Candidatus Solibacter sp.]
MSHHEYSKPAATNLALQRVFNGKGDLLASIPSVPAVLQTLLDELNQPADTVNLLRVAEIIGRDETLAAQSLRMANSALFSRKPAADSLRGAVRTLGIDRIRDIAISCGLMRIVPSAKEILDPLIFWQHSLACAIIARKLARSVGFGDPEKAYLAGLMHDIGYVVNLVVLPNETKAAMLKARSEGRFAGEVEFAELGFTHCQSGEMLGRQWRLSDGLIEVILCHHDSRAAEINPALVAIVSLSDRLCRASDLGLGYAETPGPLEDWREDWDVLLAKCPFAAEVTWEAFVADSKNYVEEIHKLVEALYKA